MNRLLQALRLPLLSKELIEQSARRRTYFARGLYAALLFIASLIFLADSLQYVDPLYVLGKGKEVFIFITVIQTIGIYLFLPAMLACVIPVERERGTLALLLLTGLSPAQIVLQKLFSRLIPMLYLLLLSMPLLAVCYALGGMEFDRILPAMVVLICTLFQVGLITLACSAFCRSTAGAFMATYAVLAALFFGPLFTCVVPMLFQANDGDLAIFMLALSAPTALVAVFESGWLDIPFAVLLIPCCLTMVAAFFLARYWLVARADVKPTQPFKKVFGLLDRFFHWLNRMAGGIRIGRGSSPLPEDNPIAWRQVSKTALGPTHHLLRMVLLLEIPLIFFGWSGMISDGFWAGPWLAFFGLCSWIIVPALMVILASNLFNSERSRQTLDVLMTTPIPSRQILSEKMGFMHRLWFALSVPFLTLLAFRGVGGEEWGYPTRFSLGQGIGLVLLAVVLIPLATYVGVLAGLYVRSHGKAMVTALGFLAAWCVLPVFLFALMEEFDLIPNDLAEFLTLSSPAKAVVLTEVNEFRHIFPGAVWGIGISFVLYGSMAWLVRRLCYARLDRCLGRVAGHE